MTVYFYSLIVDGRTLATRRAAVDHPSPVRPVQTVRDLAAQSEHLGGRKRPAGEPPGSDGGR